LADPLLHLLIPAMTLLALYDRAQIKWVITLLPFTILPDIDHINALFTLNRALLHNVFCLIPLVLIALYGIKSRNNTLTHIGTIATFYWATHILLDLDGVRALWPLSGNVFALNVDFIPIGNLWYATSRMSVEYLLVFLLGLLVSIPNVSRNYFMFSKRDAEKPGSPILGETPIITPSSTQRKREWMIRREHINIAPQVNRSVGDPRLQPKRS
jgi:hypothetical protein